MNGSLTDGGRFFSSSIEPGWLAVPRAVLRVGFLMMLLFVPENLLALEVEAFAGSGSESATAETPSERAIDDVVVEIQTDAGGEMGVARTLSLTEALDRALSENLDIALARAEEEIARGRYGAELGSFYPSLEFGGLYRRRDGRIQGSFGNIVDGLEFSTYEERVGLAYRLNILEEIYDSIASRRDLDTAVLQRLDKEQRIILRVTELYHDLLLTKIGVAISGQLVDHSEQLMRITSARANTGLGLGSDVARAKARLASDRQEQIRARALWRTASVRLAQTIRADPSIPLDPVESQLSPVSLPLPEKGTEDRRQALGRPDVEAARKNLDAAASRKTAAWWDLFGPDLAAGVGTINLGEDTDDLRSRHEYGVVLLWGLSIEKIGRIHQRQAEEEAARLRVADVQDRALSEIEIVRREIESAQERIPFAHEALDAANTNLRITMARFREGTAIALEVFDAQDTLAQSRFDLARTIASFNLAQVRFLAASGVLDRSLFARGSSSGAKP